MCDMDQQTAASNNRIVWIDLLGCIAIPCVVPVRATEVVYDFNLEIVTLIRPTVVFAFAMFITGWLSRRLRRMSRQGGGLMDFPCCSFRRPDPFRPCGIVTCVCAARGRRS